MMRFSIRTQCPEQSRIFDVGEFESLDAAWVELTGMCSDMARGIIRKHLKANTEWQMELLDEAGKPLGRIRLLAETVA
jgi:hypothetical protein